MKNLSSDIEQRVRTMMASLTPEARLRMASRMFATGRSLALAGRTTFGTDRRVFLFDRLYSSDFSERERARILSRMETRAELTARETSQLD